MVSPHHWNSAIQIGDHMLARQFLKAGWQVCFLSDPVTPFHLLKGFELGPRLKNYMAGGYWNHDRTLWGYVPGSLVMPYNVPFLRSRWVYDSWQNLSWPNLLGKIRKNGFGSVDVIYFRTTRQTFLLDEIEHQVSLFRIPDHDASFFDYNDEVSRREKELAGRVDLTVYTSKPLESYVARLAPRNMHYLPNGVDFDFFATPAEKPVEYEGLEGPVALHVGSALPERFDFRMVEALAEAFPHVNFVYVGPDKELKKRIPARSNIYFLGPRPYASIPGYIQHADVGLVLLDIEKNPDLVNSTNPLKLYQYLAGGLPVVSSEWDVLKGLKVPAYLARNRGEFVGFVGEALSSERFAADELKAFARRFDWEERYTSLVKKLGEVSSPLSESLSL